MLCPVSENNGVLILKPVKIRSYTTIMQILILLVLAIGLAVYKKEVVIQFFQTTQTGQMGLILNGMILILFLFGLLRIILLFMSFAREQGVVNRFIGRIHDKVANPTYQLGQRALIVERYKAVQHINQQNAVVDQSALAATLAATQTSRFTLVRFVHNTLILMGVFGTIISLSVALVGAADLLDSPDSLSQMGTIIGGMSTALSTTITAILCYVFFTYFHLRLQDARTQLLANIEEVTALHILPAFHTMEESLLQDVTALTTELRHSAEAVRKIQDRFLQAGDRLQLAVDDLQNSIGSGSEDIRIIRESLREGFRLADDDPSPASPPPEFPHQVNSPYTQNRRIR
uniref:Uncharacterized protein n=1 Tax=uncultured Thiotrichaceae bacterium TaxID=298394 RepID=A0A6S6TRL8_9GAMM|nr:MAG: Unknown protein [uncultured Thiotrichaceae bacterium]